MPDENLLIMGGEASYGIKMEVKQQDIVLRTNATTSEWLDLMDSIQDGYIIVGLSSGEEDSTTALRKFSRQVSLRMVNLWLKFYKIYLKFIS